MYFIIRLIVYYNIRFFSIQIMNNFVVYEIFQTKLKITNHNFAVVKIRNRDNIK